MWFIKNNKKIVAQVFEVMTVYIASCVIVASHSFAAPSFESLETDIYSASPDKLSLIEHDVARFIQERPLSPKGQYAMSSLLLRMFLHDPTNTDLIRQSADLAAQAYELDPKSELGIVALASILDVTGDTEKGLALLNETLKKNVEISWRYHLAKAKLLSAEEGGKGVFTELLAALSDTTANRALVAPYVVAALNSIYQGQTLLAELKKWDDRFHCEDFTLAMAQVQSSIGKLNEALASYRSVIKLNPRHAEAQLGEGLILLKAGLDYKAASASLRKAVNLDLPQYLKSSAILSLSVALLRAGNIKDGTEEAANAIAASQNQEAAIIILTNEYKIKKRYAEAIAFLTLVDDVAPGVSLNHAIRGELLISSFKKHADAVDAFSNAIVLDNTKSVYYNGRGLAFSGMRKTERALIDFETAVRVDPTDASARYNMACALALLNRKNEALEALASALDLDERLYNEALVDNDFKNLHAMEEFQAITGKLKSTPVVAH